MAGNDSNEFDSSYLEILLVNCHAMELYNRGLIIFGKSHHSNIHKLKFTRIYKMWMAQYKLNSFKSIVVSHCDQGEKIAKSKIQIVNQRFICILKCDVVYHKSNHTNPKCGIV